MKCTKRYTDSEAWQSCSSPVDRLWQAPRALLGPHRPVPVFHPFFLKLKNISSLHIAHSILDKSVQRLLPHTPTFSLFIDVVPSPSFLIGWSLIGCNKRAEMFQNKVELGTLSKLKINPEVHWPYWGTYLIQLDSCQSSFYRKFEMHQFALSLWNNMSSCRRTEVMASFRDSNVWPLMQNPP